MTQHWPRRENRDKLGHQSHANAMKNSFRLVRGCFVLACALVSVRAAELSVKDGLLFHLDAANQSTRRQSAGLPSIGNGRPLDRWLDSSGGPLVATQPAAASRPVFRADDAEAFVRFDGKDDYLAIASAKRRMKEVTLFVLAAPRSNRGFFTGMFGGAVAGQNDYTSGLNLDLGPTSTKELSVLNVESVGAGGFRNFIQPGKNLASPLPFEGFHVFTVRSKVGAKGNEMFLDGIKLGERERKESTIGLDDMVIGGRIYSNDGGEPPFAQGFFDGDIAAVLVYERALNDSERTKVEESLFARTPALNALATGSRGHALETLKDAPTVQMFVPGFTAEEMPLKMRNLTGIRYRYDGVLVGLGYDGRIHLITDTDGDGREDKSTVFWDQSVLRGPIGMALLPKSDWRGDGVFVASKGKVSLILDRDRDGTADEELIVAKGWKEIMQSVDAIGLAVDPKDGSIYFGLGTENFANGYLIDGASGKSNFKITTEHGTIQRVSADFSKRETVCTGVRFTCALAFNRHGDLFASEQEGATWLPNGNPFDELLHIQPGLHYGFPPRHPKHLPQVIDEPPVFEYGPQHQSTVGMIFNEGVNGGPSWGPTNWAGDALLCGESRGKLYRTKLVKTPAGYVAQNHLIASLTMLLVDACVTPKGDLLLACHSGPPDWGTGPAGEGKIFRVRHVAKTTPQPVLAWAAAPDEFRIAFDRPLRDSDWVGAREKTRIEAGRYVSAGDRFETIRPGYQVVRDQMAAPRRWVDVQSLALSADRRTLVLRVPRQTEAVSYAITLPTPASWQTKSTIVQKPEIDVVLMLNGIQATLEAGGQSSKIVLPHSTPAVARAFTAGSEDHEAFFKQLDEVSANTRTLTLRGGVNVGNIFVPSVQPGTTLDWDLSADAFANRTMSVRQDFSATTPRDVPVKADRKTSIAPLQLALSGPLALNGSGLTFALDDKVRPITQARLSLPWASTTAEKKSDGEALARSDVKGNWLHGRRVFFADGGCATCHTLRGEGTAFGPDLSNLVFRDRDSVFHDITKPSATINPDMTGSLVKFEDGTEVSGIVQTLNDEKIVVRQPANAQTERPRRDVASIEPMKNSLMPDAMAENLSPKQMEDLLTFLLTNPLEPTRITRLDPPMPPARTREEIAGFVPSASTVPDTSKPLDILLCIDDKDHGVDEHDYPVWQQRWSKLLALADNVTVTTAKVFPTREQLAASDVTIFYSRNSGWNTERAKLLDEYQQRGGGLVYLHWAVAGGKEATALAERIGLGAGLIKFRHGDMELAFTQPTHPITQGFTKLKLIDESYWMLSGDEGRVSVLAKAVEENAPRTQLWSYEKGNGRVFGSIPGHYMWTFDDPLYRVIVLRGICWAAKLENVDRLSELALVGARVAGK
jgi:putative heme-binding domain-containing protein